MNRSICAVAVAAGLVGAVWPAAPVSAAPTGGTKAPDVVRELSAAGYAVQINGDNGVPLSQCTVTDVHGVPAARTTALQFTTVYVDVECEPEG
ncbi:MULTISPECIES: hypothetical protein [unclassified Mycolicibacterium]|uniref:hypothetical protein n=1 Tax=unclassified Mycolicibacterium TaxID=2636767 RepID=UPI0012DFE931|nr:MULTISPECIES: hypothetical protein [unclassified Mycolicibacterium]MUL81092.1 hypothetical protein [Mycolicibacterium sp. CBMA 329]MUL86858.1 hypothetical protein [Mycolicibacterium sp. CBMA 331]MUL98857.1 hypothetical protein [Mycolicibacterium sp. CBMA 334]MUM28883.1 hypothetical protein [Mycolicibacterium sp. CBMA 295]MUM37155.1 hypothetical protein [Mycolicibacterium sp. CBMA 247]